MKVFVLFLCILLATVLAFSGNVTKDIPAPPDAIECLNLVVDSVQYHADLRRPIAANDKAQVRLAFLRFAQELSITGSQEDQARGKKAVSYVLESGDYVVGRVCYVMKTYCAPDCTGQGCATIRVPSIK